MNKRIAFFVSDGTGLTAEALGHSLLSQFRDIHFEQFTLPYVDSAAKANEALQRINRAAERFDNKPIVFVTIVDTETRSILQQANAFLVDIFTTFVGGLEQELATSSAKVVGSSHAIDNDPAYDRRMAAVHYALDNDDGARLRDYDTADIILVGVSRSGKTPTCLYLALHFGIRAANYPITEEDLETLSLPRPLKAYQDKLFGLTIRPERLAKIRNERRSNSRYASLNQCEFEVRQVEMLFRKTHVPFIDSTHYSVEEIATKIMATAGIERHVE